MNTALKIAGAGLGLAVIWRLYQASRFNVPFATALRHPFLPISTLQVQGRAPGVGSFLQAAQFSETRSGRGAF